MAALKNSATNVYDDDVAVNVGGTWSNRESGHSYGLYTFVPEATWNYPNAVYAGLAAGAAGVGGKGRVFGTHIIDGRCRPT